MNTNHSLNNNIDYIYTNCEKITRLTRDVKAGEEMLQNYCNFTKNEWFEDFLHKADKPCFFNLPDTSLLRCLRSIQFLTIILYKQISANQLIYFLLYSILITSCASKSNSTLKKSNLTPTSENLIIDSLISFNFSLSNCIFSPLEGCMKPIKKA